jgi:hypothetical protein
MGSLGSHAGWDELADLAVDSQARRVLVPVLGSGFVAQACRVGGSSPPAWASSSTNLLIAVARENDASDAAAFLDDGVPGQHALLWERMTVKIGTDAAYRTDRRLRRALARRFLEDAETPGVAKAFVDSFLALGFEHVVSFNFDNVLNASVVRASSRYSAGRWSMLSGRSGQTKVWYPHGHSSLPDSIVLGSRAYGTRIADFQEAFDRESKSYRSAGSQGVPEITSVVAAFMWRPLLFLGLSLTREEWTLWWLLAQRSRFRKRKDPQPCFAVVKKPAPDDADGMAGFNSLQRAAEVVGLRLLVVKDHDTGWKRLAKALGWTLPSTEL